MLRRRGIPAVMVTGVRVSEDSSLHAHAWVRTDPWTADRDSEGGGFAELVTIGQKCADR
jgi:hypothetical protein